MYNIWCKGAENAVNPLVESLVFLWLLAAVALLLYSGRLRRREAHLSSRVREGRMYARLHTKMAHLLSRYDIDQVRVERHGVTVTSVYPAHTLLTFDFKQNGNGKRCDAIARLVAQLLEEDFPALAMRDTYRLSRYRVYRANGRADYGYSFTMRRHLKDRVISSQSSAQLRIL